MARYEDQICEAIETIVSDAIASAGFDKTIQGTIIECTNASIAEYKVSYRDSKFYAYASNTEVTYSNNTQVYILIPNNDMSKPKTILGTVRNAGIEYSNVIEEEDTYNIVGNNLISNNSEEIELCSYNENQQVVLFDDDNNINLISINQEDAKEYITEADGFKTIAFFRTSLPVEQRYKGNYGIVFELEFEIDGNTYIKDYTFDINNMKGTPYIYIHQRQSNIVFLK